MLRVLRTDSKSPGNYIPDRAGQYMGALFQVRG